LCRRKFPEDLFVLIRVDEDFAARAGIFDQPEFYADADEGGNKVFIVMIAAGGIDDLGEDGGFHFGPLSFFHLHQADEGGNLDGGGVAE